MKPSAAIIVVLSLLAGLLAGLCCYTFIYAKGYSYLTNNPAACTNCHVMQAEYDAWVKSSHRAAATCNDCHTPHNLIGKYAVKANNGFWHSFYFTTGKYPDNIEITNFDHKVTENACRRCHENITAAIDAQQADEEAGKREERVESRGSWIVIRESWMAGYDLRFTLRGSPSASILRCS